MRGGRDRADRARGEGRERARGVGPLVCRAGVASGSDRARIGPTVALGRLPAPAAVQTDRARGARWLYAGLREAGLAVELLETRHVRDAFKAMPVKTDRPSRHLRALDPLAWTGSCALRTMDARGIAQLMRLGWFRPVHCRSLPAQETRALLTARKLLQAKLHDVEMSLRGILRGFGLKVGATTAEPSKRASASWWPSIRR